MDFPHGLVESSPGRESGRGRGRERPLMNSIQETASVKSAVWAGIYIARLYEQTNWRMPALIMDDSLIFLELGSHITLLTKQPLSLH